MTPGRGGARDALLRALALAPLLSIVAYGVVLAQRVPSLVHDTATSDSVGPMVIAESLPSAHSGSTVVMGNAAHYTTLWFDEATRWLPGHDVVWQAMPYVLSLLGLLLLAATVRRLAGWRAALITLGIGMATPPLLLLPLLAQAYHSTTFVNGIVLAALLVWLAMVRDLRAPRVIAAAAVLAVVTGLDVASDPLLLVTGVAPFAAAAALAAWRRRSRRAVETLFAAAGVVAIALVAAGATVLVMRHQGFQVQGLPLTLASPARANDNATLLGHLLLDMANGRLSLHDLGDLGLLRLLCGVLIVAAALVPLSMLLRLLQPLHLLRRPQTSSPPNHRDSRERGDGGAPIEGRDVFLAFWGCTALFTAIAFIATTLPIDRNSIRYLPPLFYAIAATVPFVAMRSRAARAAIAGAVAVVGLTGAVLLHRASLVADFNVQPQHGEALLATLEQHGLHRGYAGYWQANLVTWQSGGRIESRAVQQGEPCNAVQRGWFCPYPIFTVSDWYAPQGGPTYLIREQGGAFVPDPPPDALGTPREVLHVDRFDIYVFDHDIGADAARVTTGWPGSTGIVPVNGVREETVHRC
ncbi:MAG TPA: hypothetical protein VGQ42_01505 [Candidatus Dormibacteraeota bacterium]|nr:hypothetical protein [Candidatus Dormibacteraeota bacterium]